MFAKLLLLTMFSIFIAGSNSFVTSVIIKYDSVPSRSTTYQLAAFRSNQPPTKNFMSETEKDRQNKLSADLDEKDNEFIEISARVKNLAESQDAIERLVGEHAQSLQSAVKVIYVLGEKVVEQDKKINSLNLDVTSLNADMALIMRERCNQRKLMVMRQLATSYQFRAATILGYGNAPNRRFMVTHEQLQQSNKIDSAKLTQLEITFSDLDANLVNDNIGQDIREIRNIGVDTSHPALLIADDGNEYSPTEKDLRDVVDELCSTGRVQSYLRSCAHGLISNIVRCSADPLVQNLVGNDLLKNSP